MIERMHRIAKWIYPLQTFILLIAMLSFGGFFYVVFSGELGLDKYMFPSIVMFAWSMCLFGISEVLSVLPQTINQSDGFFRRLKKRIKHFFAWLWSLGFTLCSIVLAYFSIRSIGMLIGIGQ